MRSINGIVAVLLLGCVVCGPAWAGESWSDEQQEILDAIALLSASTAPGGGGPDAYAAVLADGFTRWTTGRGLINTRESWVTGVKGWFEDGWRVSDRQQEVLEIVVDGDTAFTRRIVEETYLGPDGDASVSKAGLAETWVRGEGGWLLYRVDAVVMDGS